MNNQFKTVNMKNNEQHEHAATGRYRNGNHVSAGFYSNFIENWLSEAGSTAPYAPEPMPTALPFTGGDRLQTQNLAKAPPGQTLGTGPPRGHPPEGRTNPPAFGADKPENKAGPPAEQAEVSLPANQTIVKSEKEEMNNHNKKMKHYKHLIFITMKKQILFLAVFVMAIFAATKSYAQPVTYTNHLTGAPVCANAVGLPCTTEDALHPLPGKPYTYSITVDGNTTVPTGTTVLWYVTDQPLVIDGTSAATPTLTPAASRDGNPGSYVLTASAGTYNVAGTSTSIDISWKTFDATAHQVLLVAYITDGCTDNVVAFRIQPSFAFTLDVVALLQTGAQGSTECVSPVESANYDGTKLNMNYGENWVYFSVTAANFVHSWMPDFSTTTYTGGGTLDPTSIQWAYSANAQSAATNDWHAATDPVMAQATGGAVGSAGECIVVRARIVNGASPLGGTFDFGVDGTMYDPAATPGAEYTNTNLKDLENSADDSSPCSTAPTDHVTYTITNRPVIVSTTPGNPSGILNYVPKVN